MGRRIARAWRVEPLRLHGLRLSAYTAAPPPHPVPMTESLRCPTCSAPLDPPAPNTRMMKCPYCGASAMLTERRGHREVTAAQDRRTDDVAEVVRLLRAGRKIEAVRAYHERFGVGLKEAKDAVDRIEAGQPAGAVPAASPRGALGCVLVAIVLATGVAGLVAWLVGRSEPGTGASAAAEEILATPGRVPGAPAFAEEVLRFGSEGTGAGRFEDARSVAVDGAGRIYVAEYQGGRVQVFDSTGAFLTQWTADPEMPLRDLAATRDGTVYVVQRGHIARYDGATGTPLAALPHPDLTVSYDAVAVALDGSLWATAFPADLLHLSRDGAVLQRLDLREVVHDGASPDRVAVTGAGDVYVTDRSAAEVYRLDPSGRFVDRFGGRGERPDHFRSPHGLAVDGRGRVYVSDLGNGIRVFDADGHFLDAFGGRTVVFGLAINDRDEVFAAHRNEHQVVKYRVRR